MNQTLPIHEMKNALSDLRELLKTPFDDQKFAWKRELYRLVPFCYYEVVGNVTGPDGRKYAAVKLCEDFHIDQIKNPSAKPTDPNNEMTLRNIDGLIEYCMNRAAGIAIISSQENVRPDAMLTFGHVWSYYEYKNLEGTANSIYDFEKAYELDPERPFDLVVEETDRMLIGSPSNEFFPDYIRSMMSDEIRAQWSDAAPEFALMTEKRYAISTSILVDTKLNLSPESAGTVRDQLIWYMPPYLPIYVR